MLAKLILLSLVISTIVLPMRAAQEPSPRRALGRALVWLLTLDTLYMIGVVYVLPRIS